MKSLDFIKEDIVTDAHEAHVDHEVQMARSDCFHAAEDALTLHRMLREIPETVGLEGWVAAKITLAADYLNTVREYLEYQLVSGDTRPEMAAMTVIDEGAVNDSPVANAIARRIMSQHVDLLSKYGPAAVMQAIDSVADFVGAVEEIGTSDVSGWVKQVASELANMPQGVLEGSGVTDYNPRSQGGTRKDLIARFHKTKDPKDAEAARKAGATQKELQGVSEGQLDEMSAGSVATVVNPTPKNKAKVGTLFGGTYKQKPVKKAK